MSPRQTLEKIESTLRAFALAYPETHEDFPWGERVVKVRGKVFVFLGSMDDRLGVTVKLPRSHEVALQLPFVERTGYGLGQHGWVSARLPAAQAPLALLEEWIDESYRAVAPKTLVARLPGGVEAPTRRPPARGRKGKRARRS